MCWFTDLPAFSSFSVLNKSKAFRNWNLVGFLCEIIISRDSSSPHSEGQMLVHSPSQVIVGWRTWESKARHEANNKTIQQLCRSNQISMFLQASANAANSPATCLWCWVLGWFQLKTLFASTKTVWNMLRAAWLFASGSLELGATLFPNFLQKICRNFGENCCAVCGLQFSHDTSGHILILLKSTSHPRPTAYLQWIQEWPGHDLQDRKAKHEDQPQSQVKNKSVLFSCSAL